jgi:hypothetical protein
VRTILTITILLLALSCAKNDTAATTEAIDVALTHLSNEECDEALDALRDVGPQNGNPVYLQVLASAYACRAGYNEIRFIADDLAAISVTTPQGLFKSLAVLRLSDETAADSEAFVDLRRALDTIYGGTAGAPTHAKRVAKFGPRKAGDLSVQALLLSIVNLGKFLNYYGNTDASGNKGGVAGSNCFLDYNDSRAQLLIGAGVSTGACVAVNDGHPDLDQTTAAGKRRLCEGLVLLTNTLEILEGIDLGSSSTLAKLEQVADQVDDLKTVATAQGLGDVINMTSQTDCVAYAATPANLNNLEYFYALVFEEGLL